MKNVKLKELLWIPLDRVPPLKLNKLKKSLITYKKFDCDLIELYKMDIPNNLIGIPIHHFKSLKDVQDCRVSGTSINFEFTSKYRKGQEEVVQRFFEYYDSGDTGFVIEAVPGWGKTCVCIKLISLVGKTTLVIVPRSNLVKQWISRLIEHSTLKRSEIGIAMGGEVNYKNKKVVVGLVHTVCMDRFGDDFKNFFGMVVFDEVDRTVPPQTFCTVASMFPAKIRLAVSATLERIDGLDSIYRKHIGQRFIKANDVGTTLKPKIVMHNYNTTSGYVPDYLQKLQRRGVLISRISENDERNMVVARYAMLIYNSDRQCLVISDRIKQLQFVKKLLISYGVSNKEIGFYCRQIYDEYVSDRKISITESERKNVARDCKIILGTYGMISLGTDIASLAGLVMATPQSYVKQTIGRIVRKMKGKKQPVVVDIVDSKYADALKWAYARRKYYESEALFVKVMGN